MTLQTLAERATEVAEAQPKLIELIELITDAHNRFGLNDEQRAELQDYTNQAMEILRDLGR
ncbi:hypothetical protein RSA11_04530 [Exiguobacterium indicum]|uniref:Uncharacterized protein n=1 Tax=Exiguobacterium indicum TaxID=296995 RepID=A0AAW3MFC8_9BACL|nr:hypothetical protein [Exiguobacterium indicum]KTR27929.1 hypothetical protein RSA11_04530 [Exiguobacterium indicum]